MPALDLDGYAAALKRMYPWPRVENGTFRQNVTFAKIKKNPNVGGESWTRAVHYEDIAGSSATFSKAQANKAGSKKVAFRMTSVDDYSLASIKGKTMKASEGNTKALLAATKSEVDSAFNAQKRRIGIRLFRTGHGDIGQISSITTTAITLTSKADINNFAKGMKLQFASTQTGEVRDVISTVLSVNRRAGATTHITLASDPGVVENGDYIFIDGDAYNNDDYKCVRGFLAWMPTTAPTAGDSFFGVDRSVDVVRLAGNCVSATGLTMEELVIELAMECAEQGGLDSGNGFCVMPYLNYKALLLELTGRKEYVDEKIAGVSFRGVRVETEVGPITVFPDRNCPAGYAFMIDPDYWSYDSIGQHPMILDLDNVGKLLREASDDAYELRIGGYPQVSCGFPGSSGVANNLPTS